MITRNLETRIKKLEASIVPEVQVMVIQGYRDGEDKDAAIDRHLAAHPEDRGAPLVVFLRNIAGEKAALKAKQGGGTPHTSS